MREMARRPQRDRRDLFRAAAQQMGVHEAIIEKDFWVCWVLDYLFQDSIWKDRLAFKGGTSLSKAFGAIERFSEDIDLILDWQVLGYAPQEPWDERTATRQDAFGKECNQRTALFLAQDMAPALGPALARQAGAELEVTTAEQNLFIAYPRAFSLAAIQPQIRLEIGPMAAWIPNTNRSIHPYAAEQFPRLFSQAETLVRTIGADRTFWEKATILHQEAHRSPEKRFPARYSRHYYDLYRLSLLPIGAAALANLELLRDVVQFKMRFYRCPWACYEKAWPGSLRLVPSREYLVVLRQDYQAMQNMLFGQIPAFEDIMAHLAALEQTINELRPAQEKLDL